MTPEQFTLLKQVLLSAEQLPVEAQFEYVTKACEGDEALIKAVMAILQSQDAEWAKAIERPAIITHLTEAERVDLIPELEEGTQVNAYTVLKKIGSGGMGHVYIANQGYPAERQVALKMIKQQPNQKYLIREIQILASLNHPNIATLYEIDQTADGQSYIAMEWVDGTDIISWSQNHACNQAQRIDLFLQLCQGIAYAHEKGIIHCDIKPNNVLVTEVNESAVVKIIDFGVSQFQDLKSDEYSISGTPSYLAPEVLNSKTKPLADTRRDIFAMGVLLRKLLAETPLTKDLSAIIAKATAEQPEERYPSVLTMHDDLHHYFEQRPISARPHNLAYLSVLFIRRRLGVVVFSLALLVTVVGGYWAQRQQAQLATEQAVLAKQAQTEAEELSSFLTNLFNVANPEKDKEAAVTAVELLNTAKDRLLGVEQPTLSEARFMHTIGSIMTRMDQFADAEALIKQSLVVKQQNLPANHEEIISGLSQLGMIQRRTLDYVNAEQTLLQSIALAETQDPVNKEQLAFAHNHLGNVYTRMHQPDLAINQHLKAAKLRTAVGDRKHLADSYNNLGVIYRQTHDWAQAVDYTKQALSIYLEMYDAGHPFIGAIKHNLAYLEEQSHNWEQSDQLLQAALQSWKAAYGINHTNTLTGIENQVLYYQRRLRFDETLPILEEVISHLEAAGNREKQASFLSLLGKSQAHLEQPEAAENAHQRSISIIEGVTLKDKNFKSRLLIRYAETLLKLQHLPAAESTLTLALDELQSGSAQRFLQMKAQNFLAQVKWNMGHLDEAEQMLLHFITKSVNDTRRLQIEQINAMLTLGRLYRQQGRHDQAASQLNQALQLSHHVFSEYHKMSGQILAELGRVEMDLGLPKSANKFLQQALTIQQQALPSLHPDLLATQADLNRINSRP